MPIIKNTETRERNAQRFFGCTEADALAANGNFPLRQRHTPASRYLRQRQGAYERGVGWEITFIEWLTIWRESGKWDQRGTGKKGYCMARNGDVGPYKIGNVSIQPSTQNSRDGVKLSHAAMRAAGWPRPQLGRGRGWTFAPKTNKTNPYQVTVCHTHIGFYPTQELAEAAYLAAAGERKSRPSKQLMEA